MLEKVYIVLVEDENGESMQIHSVHSNEDDARNVAESIERQSDLIAYVEEHSVT
jgi:hypothetical protein